MPPVVRMLLLLAAAGILSAIGMRQAGSFIGYMLSVLAILAFLAGLYNYYLHARTKWPFRKGD